MKEHPEWFRARPDGTIQYAENPPKKYQDIYPFDFESEDWQALWDELKSVFEFWVGHGVKIFRVDNPHTKPFAFWEWCIARAEAEASRADLPRRGVHAPARDAQAGQARLHAVVHLLHLAQHEGGAGRVLHRADASIPSREYFRPNFWPNTPDILHETLQQGGRPAFIVRAVLAATLAANYGIYGPAYELQERAPREPGSEEYLNSEKYEIKQLGPGARRQPRAADRSG